MEGQKGTIFNRTFLKFVLQYNVID